MSLSSFIVANNVQYRAPSGHLLLHPTSFVLEKSSILAISGPNGAGKTTLMNILCGKKGCGSSEVLINGKNIDKLSVMERAQMFAVVRQDELPDGRLSLRDYVALGQIPICKQRSYLKNSSELERILELTKLSKKSNQPMMKLSGGERQRAHIARALAQNPSCLFLDEPTNHLDPDAKGQILSLVTNLGITVVMIIHDLVMIPQFATHVALMKSGRLLRFGFVDEVLTAKQVKQIFNVNYLCFHHQGRRIPALDIHQKVS